MKPRSNPVELLRLKGNFLYCISVVINCMLCHGYDAPTSILHAAVIPIPKNAKLNLSSTCNYRAIALSSIFFSKILDKIIMSLQSEYLMTSELYYNSGLKNILLL